MARVGKILQFARYYSSYNDDTLHTAFPENEDLTTYAYEGAGAFYLMFEFPDYNVGATTPIYRLYSPTLRDHWHTPLSFASGYYNEGVVGYVYNSNGPYRRAMYSYVIYRNGLANHYNSFQSTPFTGYTSLGLAYYAPLIVYGCSDSSADNYNVYVNQTSTGCTYSTRGCTDSRATNYNPSANVDDGSCRYPTPSITLTVSPSSIIQGQNATISWNVSNSTTRSLTDFGAVATSGSQTISPSDDRTYTLSASYYGITTNSKSVTLPVYVPPVVTLTVDNPQIILGQSTILRWSTTGDASTANISPGIGSSNLTSNVSISPTQTTTYTAYVSGLGGNDSAEVTVTVLQPPILSITGPANVDYGNSVTLQWSQENAVQSLEIRITAYDLDSNPIYDTIPLTAEASSEGTTIYTPSWGDRGPFWIEFKLYGEGTGGLYSEDAIAVHVNIDQTPDLIDIPESQDKIQSQDPVITPDVEVTTLQLAVNDIDIPVRIKADYPIQVEIDNSGTYTDVEQI